MAKGNVSGEQFLRPLFEIEERLASFDGNEFIKITASRWRTFITIAINFQEIIRALKKNIAIYNQTGDERILKKLLREKIN